MYFTYLEMYLFARLIMDIEFQVLELLKNYLSF